MNENIFMVRGDTLQFSVLIEELTTNLTNVYFSCKANKDDDNYIFQCTLGNGIELTESTNTSRTYTVTVPASATKDLDDGIYYYDLQINLDEYVYTPFMGTLNIAKDVTYV